MRYTLLFVFIFLSIQIKANSYTGIILDKKTNEPIAYANILIKGTNKGTVTNNEGEFLINNESEEIVIVCSVLGYKKDTCTLNSTLPYNEIFLSPLAIKIDEITVTPENYPRSILQTAIRKIRDSTENFVYSDAFYRQMTRINNLPSEFQEIIYKAKATNTRIKEIAIEQGRYAVKNDAKFKYINAFSFINKDYWNKIEDEYAFILSNSNLIKYELIGFIKGDNDEQIAKIKVGSKNPSSNLEKGFAIYYVNVDNFEIIEYEGESLYPFMFINDGFGKLADQKLTFNIKYEIYNSGIRGIKSVVLKSTFLFKHGLSKEASIEVAFSAFLWNHNYSKPNFEFAIPIDKGDREVIDNTNYESDFWNINSFYKRTTAEDEVINSFNKTNSFGRISQ